MLITLARLYASQNNCHPPSHFPYIECKTENKRLDHSQEASAFAMLVTGIMSPLKNQNSIACVYNHPQPCMFLWF